MGSGPRSWIHLKTFLGVIVLLVAGAAYRWVPRSTELQSEAFAKLFFDPELRKRYPGLEVLGPGPGERKNFSDLMASLEEMEPAWTKCDRNTEKCWIGFRESDQCGLTAHSPECHGNHALQVGLQMVQRWGGAYVDLTRPLVVQRSE